MNFLAKTWPGAARHHSAVSRILVHFPDTVRSEDLIPVAVELATRSGAQLRGLTLVDTSQLEDITTSCESAAAAVIEQHHLETREEQRNRVRTAFSQACLNAGIDFDIRRRFGNSLDILKEESKVHDLIVTYLQYKENQKHGDLAGLDVMHLIRGGIDPLLVLREKQELPQRILLIQDGTPATNRAMRSFLMQQQFPEATVRLLAVGSSEATAQKMLHDHYERIRRWVSELETGFVAGSAAKVVPQYVSQWDADLVVIGTSPRHPLVGSIIKDASTQILNKTQAALYTTF